MDIVLIQKERTEVSYVALTCPRSANWVQIPDPQLDFFLLFYSSENDSNFDNFIVSPSDSNKLFLVKEHVLVL